jgi:hypothetical protein
VAVADVFHDEIKVGGIFGQLEKLGDEGMAHFAKQGDLPGKASLRLWGGDLRFRDHFDRNLDGGALDWVRPPDSRKGTVTGGSLEAVLINRGAWDKKLRHRDDEERRNSLLRERW